jgi:hypothetical protein
MRRPSPSILLIQLRREEIWNLDGTLDGTELSRTCCTCRLRSLDDYHCSYRKPQLGPLIDSSQSFTLGLIHLSRLLLPGHPRDDKE